MKSASVQAAPRKPLLNVKLENYSELENRRQLSRLQSLLPNVTLIARSVGAIIVQMSGIGLDCPRDPNCVSLTSE